MIDVLALFGMLVSWLITVACGGVVEEICNERKKKGVLPVTPYGPFILALMIQAFSHGLMYYAGGQ